MKLKNSHDHFSKKNSDGWDYTVDILFFLYTGNQKCFFFLYFWFEYGGHDAWVVVWVVVGGVGYEVMTRGGRGKNSEMTGASGAGSRAAACDRGVGWVLVVWSEMEYLNIHHKK